MGVGGWVGENFRAMPIRKNFGHIYIHTANIF